MRLSDGSVLLSWPLSRHLLTVGMYYRNPANGSYDSWHGAVDLACSWDGKTRKPVYATESGTVEWVQDWDGHTLTGAQSYGNAVRLRHSNYKGSKSLQTLYAHLSSYVVQRGQQVSEGELLGYTGATGNCQGAHLHFEVRMGGKRCNPLCWLDDDFTPAPGFQPYTYGSGEHPMQRPEEARPEWGGGIDTSKHQWIGKQPVDFAAVKASGKRFVVLRAGHGWYEDQIDPYFERSYREATAAGLEVGAYWYSYASTPEEARKEAALFLQTVRGKRLGMGTWFDQEYEDSIVALTNAQRTELVRLVCDEMRRGGYLCGLYCSRNWVNHKLDAAQLQDLKLWVAAYTGEGGPGTLSMPCAVWQYEGSEGRCPGVDGPCDLDLCYEDLPSLMRTGGLCGFAAESEVLMNFKPVSFKRLMCSYDLVPPGGLRPACEVFAEPNTGSVLGKLSEGEVLQIIAQGDTVPLNGMTGTWYRVNYEPAPDGIAYVLALPDRCKVLDDSSNPGGPAPHQPPKPDADPNRPSLGISGVKVTIELTGEHLPEHLEALADFLRKLQK